MVNKVAITFALAAVVVAAYAVPAPKSFAGPTPKAVNWTDVEANVGQIETLVREAVQLIKTTASSDNEAVGSSMAAKIDQAAQTAIAILDEARVSIGNESLTETQARDHMSTLKRTLAQLIGSLSTELSQLTPEAEALIRDIFATTFDVVELLAEELYVLLGATPGSTTASTL